MPTPKRFLLGQVSFAAPLRLQLMLSSRDLYCVKSLGLVQRSNVSVQCSFDVRDPFLCQILFIGSSCVGRPFWLPLHSTLWRNVLDMEFALNFAFPTAPKSDTSNWHSVIGQIQLHANVLSKTLVWISGTALRIDNYLKGDWLSISAALKKEGLEENLDGAKALMRISAFTCVQGKLRGSQLHSWREPHTVTGCAGIPQKMGQNLQTWVAWRRIKKNTLPRGVFCKGLSLCSYGGTWWHQHHMTGDIQIQQQLPAWSPWWRRMGLGYGFLGVGEDARTRTGQFCWCKGAHLIKH